MGVEAPSEMADFRPIERVRVPLPDEARIRSPTVFKFQIIEYKLASSQLQAMVVKNIGKTTAKIEHIFGE